MRTDSNRAALRSAGRCLIAQWAQDSNSVFRTTRTTRTRRSSPSSARPADSRQRTPLYISEVCMSESQVGEEGTIVLIHGLWVNARSWEGWKHYYEAQGHRVVAPAWPGLDREVEEIRRDPSGIAGVGLREVVDHYERIIRDLGRPPIIIGHSFGGTVVQLLLDR